MPSDDQPNPKLNKLNAELTAARHRALKLADDLDAMLQKLADLRSK